MNQLFPDIALVTNELNPAARTTAGNVEASLQVDIEIVATVSSLEQRPVRRPRRPPGTYVRWEEYPANEGFDQRIDRDDREWMSA